jgi:SOS-response transcriptional repressor LexA
VLPLVDIGSIAVIIGGSIMVISDIAEVSGEMTVKQLELRPRKRLIPRNDRYPPIEDLEHKDVSIFGVVTGVVRSLET